MDYSKAQEYVRILRIYILYGRSQDKHLLIQKPAPDSMQEHWMRSKITAQNTKNLLYNPLRQQRRQPDGNITNGSRQYLMLRNLLSPRPKESSEKAKNHGQHR